MWPRSSVSCAALRHFATATIFTLNSSSVATSAGAAYARTDGPTRSPHGGWWDDVGRSTEGYEDPACDLRLVPASQSSAPMSLFPSSIMEHVRRQHCQRSRWVLVGPRSAEGIPTTTLANHHRKRKSRTPATACSEHGAPAQPPHVARSVAHAQGVGIM